jgi:hypothetical protein
MAVKYVNDFEFPEGFGFHKTVNTSKGNAAQGVKGYNTTMAGPSVVTGKSSGAGGGKHTSGSVPKFSRGGLAKGAGVGKGGNEDHGIGKTDEHFGKLNDKKSPPATRGEKSSGVQKPAFKSGGHATTPQRYAKGGHAAGCACSMCGGGMAKKAEGGSIKVAAGKVKDGAKTPWNKDDGTSPGSFKRTPPGEKMTNKAAANSKFDAEGRNTEPATKQSGNVERMTEFSDFKKGGKVHKKAKGGHATTPQRYKHGGATTPQRYAEGGGDVEPGADRYETGPEGVESPEGGQHPHKNLGGYLHKAKGGDVKVPGTREEHPSGRATQGMKVNASPAESASKYEHEAGTPGYSEPRGDYYEETSGEPHMAMGGLSRGTSPKKNAAIHAKVDHKALGALSGIVGALAGAPHQPAAPGMGSPPPGMAPQMSAPPGMAGGVRAAPPMAGGPPMAAEGGAVQHIIHHHVMHQG